MKDRPRMEMYSESTKSEMKDMPGMDMSSESSKGEMKDMPGWICHQDHQRMK